MKHTTKGYLKEVLKDLEAARCIRGGGDITTPQDNELDRARAIVENVLRELA